MDKYKSLYVNAVLSLEQSEKENADLIKNLAFYKNYFENLWQTKNKIEHELVDVLEKNRRLKRQNLDLELKDQFWQYFFYSKHFPKDNEELERVIKQLESLKKDRERLLRENRSCLKNLSSLEYENKHKINLITLIDEKLNQLENT